MSRRSRVEVDERYKVTSGGVWTCPSANNQPQVFVLRCHFSCRHRLSWIILVSGSLAQSGEHRISLLLSQYIGLQKKTRRDIFPSFLHNSPSINKVELKHHLLHVLRICICTNISVRLAFHFYCFSTQIFYIIKKFYYNITCSWLLTKLIMAILSSNLLELK